MRSCAEADKKRKEEADRVESSYFVTEKDNQRNWRQRLRFKRSRLRLMILRKLKNQVTFEEMSKTWSSTKKHKHWLLGLRTRQQRNSQAEGAQASGMQYLRVENKNSPVGFVCPSLKNGGKSSTTNHQSDRLPWRLSCLTKNDKRIQRLQPSSVFR